MTDSLHIDRIYPTTKLEPLMAPLRQAGISPDAILGEAGLREPDITSPKTLVSIDQVLTVYQAIVERAPEPMLAYHLGLEFHVTTFGMYGFAMLSSPSYQRALEIIMQYHRLSTPLIQVTLEIGEADAVWHFEPIAHPRIVGELYEFVTRLHAGIFISLQGEVMGEEFKPLHLALSFHVGPGEGVGVERLSDVTLEQATGRRSSIRFDAALLQRPTQMGSPAVNRLLLKICDEQIEALRRREGLAGQVRTALIVTGCRTHGVDWVAGRLGMTERSLRRRLAAEGVSFRKVHDDVQAHTAIQYLRDTTLTVENIAELLGYSDAANFRRAFRRWTGRPPLSYRLPRETGAV